MRSFKPTVGLINVVLDGDYQYEQEIPLGMGYIGSFLRKQGYNVHIHQCLASRGEEQLDSAAGIVADVYGIQLNMVNYIKTLELAKKIKSSRPDSIIVLGGPFLVAFSEMILKTEPIFDYVIIGEGEYTFLELLKTIESGTGDVSSVQGLVWRDSQGDVHKNSLRKLIENLDELPFPARDLLEEARHDPVDGGLLESVRMVSSRGCIGQCSFCCVNLYNKIQKGKTWRGRSPENVVDEIEYLYKNYSAKMYNFADSSFEDPGEIGKERAKKICEEIIRRDIPFSAKVYMRCETMKSHEDIELLKLYKKAGIDVVIIGAEAGSDYELRLYEKHASLDDNYRTAQILNELDMFYVLVGFIMFGPNSNPDTLMENIEFLYKLGFADNLMSVSNILMLVRDTKLYHLLNSEGRVIESKNVWELPKYTFIDSRAEKAAKYWENIYQKHPVTFETNKLQVNIGNVISRMTNRMNSHILDRFHNEFITFKKRYKDLSAELGNLHYNHFKKILEIVVSNHPDEMLEKVEAEFFEKEYPKYMNYYDETYSTFMDGIQDAGFGMSGLAFRHFSNAVYLSDRKRI
ncbi:MAG TPA: radical SAM protein [Clostridia bacterium]